MRILDFFLPLVKISVALFSTQSATFGHRPALAGYVDPHSVSFENESVISASTVYI